MSCLRNYAALLLLYCLIVAAPLRADEKPARLPPAPTIFADSLDQESNLAPAASEPQLKPSSRRSHRARQTKFEQALQSQPEAAAMPVVPGTVAPEVPVETIVEGPVVYSTAAAVRPERWTDNLTFFTALDSFKGPLDLDDLNGNYGSRTGLAGTMPLLRAWGVGLQAGSSVTWADFHGSQFTGNDTRFQNFTTVGVFQRSANNRLAWGFVHDWLIDDYHAKYHFSQWRMKFAWRVRPNDELGIWAAVPNRRDDAFLGNPPVLQFFTPLSQGAGYWQHTWRAQIVTQGYWGVAENPGEFTFGGSGQVPLSRSLALNAGFAYMLPSARGGNPGRAEESWNMTFGLTWYPARGALQANTNRFRALLPMADNGNFMFGRTDN